MTSSQAESAVSLSAFIVASTYGYRRIVELNATSPPVAHFVIGFGVVYIGLSVLADAAPALGGMMAILIAVADLIANGGALAKDLASATGQAATATGAKPAATPVKTTG